MAVLGSKVPLAVPSSCGETRRVTRASFDDLVAAGEQGWWDGEAQRLRRP